MEKYGIPFITNKLSVKDGETRVSMGSGVRPGQNKHGRVLGFFRKENTSGRVNYVRYDLSLETWTKPVSKKPCGSLMGADPLVPSRTSPQGLWQSWRFPIQISLRESCRTVYS